MGGTKATYLAATLPRHGLGFARFDNFGHGASGGRFEDGTMTRWVDVATGLIDRAIPGPLILVGSSIGGWVAVRLALARPARVAGLVGIAAAPDCTEDLMWSGMDMAQRIALVRHGVVEAPSEYGPPMALSRALIEDGRRHLVLRGPLALACPLRLLHGMADPDVPWLASQRLAAVAASTDVRVTLIKDGDHRLSRPSDLALIAAAVLDLAGPRAAQPRSAARSAANPSR
jgi:pimeloyl-ACP methyl ester carboxylesterase